MRINKIINIKNISMNSNNARIQFNDNHARWEVISKNNIKGSFKDFKHAQEFCNKINKFKYKITEMFKNILSKF